MSEIAYVPLAWVKARNQAKVTTDKSRQDPSYRRSELACPILCHSWAQFFVPLFSYLELVILNQPVGILQMHVVCHLLSVSWDVVVSEPWWHPGGSMGPTLLQLLQLSKEPSDWGVGHAHVLSVRVWRLEHFPTRFSFPECSASQLETHTRLSYNDVISSGNPHPAFCVYIHVCAHTTCSATPIPQARWEL